MPFELRARPFGGAGLLVSNRLFQNGDLSGAENQRQFVRESLFFSKNGGSVFFFL
jgi:hypothetical protein